MKVECLKKQVDPKIILKAIDNFKKNHYGDSPSYIIMNSETKYNILDYTNFIKISLYSNGITMKQKDELFGISVALCESLEFGEVDII